MNQYPMEEFMDFVDQLHRRDAEEEARQEGREEGRAEMMPKLKNAIKALTFVYPKWSANCIAAMFDIDEQIVRASMAG
ncbi:hypothetical protein [Arachidicoccus terrestris]|uniref:hypothetical protein n=1 Tax=Arachidicoccus terrestris TaxID=2875539 RepID=UPI001CC4B797|nr:hypothetical protein [Arachidicoccus terrestris]UAY55359.1 hypothetical protein K9M52_18460 [Arachidicoccus terrestris]